MIVSENCRRRIRWFPSTAMFENLPSLFMSGGWFQPCKTLVKDGQSQLFCANLRKPHATRPKHFPLTKMSKNLTSRVLQRRLLRGFSISFDFLNWWPNIFRCVGPSPAKIYECTLSLSMPRKKSDSTSLFFAAPLCSIVHPHYMHSRNKLYCKWQNCIQNVKIEFPQKRAKMNLTMSDVRSFGFCCWKTGFTNILSLTLVATSWIGGVQ